MAFVFEITPDPDVRAMWKFAAEDYAILLRAFSGRKRLASKEQVKEWFAATIRLEKRIKELREHMKKHIKGTDKFKSDMSGEDRMLGLLDGPLPW